MNMNPKLSHLLKLMLAVLLLPIFCTDGNAQLFRRKRKKAASEKVVSDVVPVYKIHISRQNYHDRINKEQKLLLGSDGTHDTILTVGADAKVNAAASYAAQNRVDWLQYEIETDSLMDGRLKANYLTGLAEILKYVRGNWRNHGMDAAHLPQIISTYREAVHLHKQNRSLAPLVKPLPYDVAYIATMPRVFKENPGYTEIKTDLVLKLYHLHPEKTLDALRALPDAPFADSLISALAPRYPQQIYDYAQANNRLSHRIQGMDDDPLVQAIVSMARNPNKSGQFYFPFLDNIVKGKITLADIDGVKNDPVKYFRLLVQTQIDYTARAANGDTALGQKSLLNKIEEKAKNEFVAKINGLHELPDAVRFKCLQPLNAEELYYVAILTDGLIYTSSYTGGVYPLMMRKAGNKGDELLKKLNFDHYRKFLSQAASYNKLKSFLGSFANKQDAADLMKSFVSGLERSGELEDGVNVADSYASIYETMPALAKEMLENVKANYDRNLGNGNKKGIAIYNILYKLFLSADSSNQIDLTRELGIPPVYNLPNEALKNSDGRIVAQVYFYGDKDGMGVFRGFLNTYGAGWKIDRSNKQWVAIHSTKGVPVSIYANIPFPEETGQDDQAQRALGAYLEENNLEPSITIHRGHSYYTNSTIAYMAPSSRIVFMGSCGGFNLIDSILQKCNDAHIIASKQIGRTAINKPFFSLLSEKLRAGNDIDWIPFWKEFRRRTSAPGFEDYIPPYKNLGAIFIKAYRQQEADAGS